MKNENTIIKLSLFSLIIVFVMLATIAGIGGYAGVRLATKRTAPAVSSTNSNTMIPVTQQITVSPGKLATDLVSANAKSIFVLAHTSTKGIQPFGIGVAITNDGIIMSTENGGTEPVVAIGDDALPSNLSLIGQDAMTGLTFFKISNKIVTPTEVTQVIPKVGANLLALYRSKATMLTGSGTTTLAEILPPLSTNSSSLQQLGIIQFTGKQLLPGTAILDESGKLFGILQDPETMAVVLAQNIQDAVTRLSANTLTENTFTNLGITITWKLQANPQSAMLVRAIVTKVAPKTPADTAGLKEGDVITAINGSTVSWDSNIARLISSNSTQMAITRADQNLNVAIIKQSN